jgi:hypothetical protein
VASPVRVLDRAREVQLVGWRPGIAGPAFATCFTAKLLKGDQAIVT